MKTNDKKLLLLCLSMPWLCMLLIVFYFLFFGQKDRPISYSKPVFENGIVVNVHDGDTIKMKNGKKIRIWGIDAPELKQEYGDFSKDNLIHILKGLQFEVKLHIYGKDLYNRYLAKVLMGSTEMDVGLWMVERGYAWVYKTNKNEVYIKAQELAKSRKDGLWNADNPVPPWVFRKIKGEENDD